MSENKAMIAISFGGEKIRERELEGPFECPALEFETTTRSVFTARR